MSAPKQKRWVVAEGDPEAESAFAHAAGLPSLTAAILHRRGITSAADAEAFLDPSIERLHDPEDLPDFDALATTMLKARDEGGRIFIHGDYDADGVTSTAIFARCLKRLGFEVTAHVPHRMREGYGVHDSAIARAKECGASIFLTCDCGISAHEQIEAVRREGMTPIVTDHHQVSETLPNAAAVVNPHRKDSTYPFRDLSGAGVALKVCQGLVRRLKMPEDRFLDAYADLAAIGTIADVMPLLGENRVIVKHGLERIARSRKPGLQALLKVARLADSESGLRPSDIGFKLGPRINAVGRIADAKNSFRLLMTSDSSEARSIAEELDDINRERQIEERRTVDEARERAEAEGLTDKPVIVIAGEGWHQGIVGLVAGRLKDAYHRPAFVVALGEEGAGKGSARSIPGFNLGEALKVTEPHHLGGGGHELAAGFSLRADMVEAFEQSLCTHAEAVLTEDDYVPKLNLDAEVHLAEFGEAEARDLKRIEPCGQANPTPRLYAGGLNVKSIRPMRKEGCAFVTLSDGERDQDAVVFFKEEVLETLGHEAPVDVAFEAEFSRWKGRETYRWKLVDARLTVA